jgi:ubiquitin carboxyl-terminal hydrolase 5/13
MEHKLKCSECGGIRLRVDEEESVGIPVPARPKSSAMEGVEEKHKEKAVGQGQSELETAVEANTKGAKVEFEPVELEECLDLLTAAQSTEYKCPKCDKSVIAWQCAVVSLSFPVIVPLNSKLRTERLIFPLSPTHWLYMRGDFNW